MTEQNGDQSRTEMEQDKAEQRRKEQSRAEQNRTETKNNRHTTQKQKPKQNRIELVACLTERLLV